MLNNIWYFLQGWVRYILYNIHPYLLPRHLRDQIDYRKLAAKDECIEKGYCVNCGCRIPHLFFANKVCGVPGLEPCYPKMMNKHEWKKFVEQGGSTRYRRKRQ